MKTPPTNGYDRLAKIYRALEFAAFGRDLERARFCFLPVLKDCRKILTLGEGDGRCLAQLVQSAPTACIDVVDMSSGMLARTARRFEENEAARKRINLIQADALAKEFPADHYDAIVTFFFLDCFTAAQVEAFVKKIERSLQPEAFWLWADFALPTQGNIYARWRARAWLTVLITFFAWQTKHAVKALPPSEHILEQAGFRREQLRLFQSGLVRSAVFSQPGSRT